MGYPGQLSGWCSPFSAGQVGAIQSIRDTKYLPFICSLCREGGQSLRRPCRGTPGVSPRHRELCRAPQGGSGFGGLHPRSPWGASPCPGERSLGRPGTPLHIQSQPFGASLSLCFYPQIILSLPWQQPGWAELCFLGDWGRSLRWGLVPHCGGRVVPAESGRAALGQCPDGSGIGHKSDLSRSRTVPRWGVIPWG